MPRLVRLLRLALLCLVACALPLQATLAMAGSVGGVGAPHGMAMAMPDGTPCPHHAPPAPGAHHGVDKASCGACCGPVASAMAELRVEPVAALAAVAPRVVVTTRPPLFLTSGPERPPRPVLA